MNDTIRERYPALFIYGDENIVQPDAETEAASGFDARIKSVWPFLVQTILAFHSRLKPREQAALDPEDILTDLWVLLRQRDHKWSIERGRYISFAGSVVANGLLKLRATAKTVKPPNNAKARLDEYQRRAEAGELDEGEAETMRRLRSVLSEQSALAPGDDGSNGESPDSDAVRREEISMARRAVIEGMAALNPAEAAALGQSFGLWGQEERRPSQIAGDRRRHVTTIKEMVAGAQVKFRERLAAKVAAGKITLDV